MQVWQWRQAFLLLMAFELPFGHAIVGSTLLLGLIVVELISGERLWPRAAGDIELAVLIGAITLSAVLSPWRSIAVTATAVFALAAFVVIRGAVMVADRNPRAVAWALGTWAWAGVVAAVWGIINLGAGLDARAELPTLGYNAFGTALATASVLMMGLTLSGSRARRLAALGGLAILIVGLALTFSRGGWLGAAVGMAVLASSVNLRRVAPAAVAAAVVAAVVVAAMAPRWAWHLDRLRNIAVAEGRFSRLAIWRAVPGLVAARPLAGWGLATFPWAHGAHPPTAQATEHPPSAHNLILNFAVETGLLGAAAMLAFLTAAIRAGVRWYRRTTPGSDERALSATTLSAIAATLATQMVDTTLMRMDLALGLFALLAFVAARDRAGGVAVTV